MGIVVKELGKKWEQIFDDPDETMIWRYDTSKNKYGPYEGYFLLKDCISD